MPLPAAIDVCRADLFTAEDELRKKYAEPIVLRVLRIRDMYSWCISNPDSKDRQFVEVDTSRYKISKVQAYSDLALVKSLLPALASASRDFHRWKFNEMILDTYAMAKRRNDIRTMERAASSYAKFNRVDLEDEQAMPYDMIVVQPFTATNDPSVLGITPIPNIEDKINSLIKKYSADTIDIQDVEYEEADLEEESLFADDEDEDDTEEG